MSAAHRLQVGSPLLPEPPLPPLSVGGKRNCGILWLCSLPFCTLHYLAGRPTHPTALAKKTEVYLIFVQINFDAESVWCVCRGELLTGCVPVNGVDKCFTGDLSAGPATCAKAQGGYNLTSFAGLLAAGKGADGREGSLCDPKVRQQTVFNLHIRAFAPCLLRYHLQQPLQNNL